jgi:hemin uptake protein HemP
VRDGCGGRKSAMVRISVLNDALKNMFNAEKRGKRQVLSQALFQSHHQVLERHAEARYFFDI